MPESKADRTLKSNEEVDNFLTYGDARGARWLHAHPEATAQAEQRLRELWPAGPPQPRHSAEHPPAHPAA
ncbi:MAG: hypothetical protein JWO63_1154 [Frankiales bacterium]|nr:hypothetical protein [Frankiales bacterium]